MPAERSTWTSLALRGAPVPSLPTALIRHPADGIAAKTCRRLKPFAAEELANLIHRRLRDCESEPVENDGKHMIVHAEPSLCDCDTSPRITDRGRFAGATPAIAGGRARRSLLGSLLYRMRRERPKDFFEIESQDLADCVDRNQVLHMRTINRVLVDPEFFRQFLHRQKSSCHLRPF